MPVVKPYAKRYPYRSAMHPEDLVPLDWQNPEAVREWLRAIRFAVQDLITVARDNTHQRNFRILDPRAARRSVADATLALRYLLRASKLGLPPEPKDGDL